MKLFLFVFAIYLSTSFGAILGVDFGHKFTKSVLLAQGVPFDLLLTNEGKRKDISGICIRPGKGDDIERIFGSGIGPLSTRFPSNCVVDLKALMGHSFNDFEIKEYQKIHPELQLEPDVTRNDSIMFDFGLRNQSYRFSAEELLAMQINEIKERASTALVQSDSAIKQTDDIAISIPPYVSSQMRQAMLDAAALAGFKQSVILVDDGTAVAINYLANSPVRKPTDKPEYYIIYDVGSGSTVATLFSITVHGNKTTDLDIVKIGHESLGGFSFTKSIHSIIKRKLVEYLGIQESNLNMKADARIWDASERATLILSANADFQVSLESIYNEKDFRTKVTRKEFEEVNKENLKKLNKPILDAAAEVGLKNVKAIILNGGSTRVPFVQKNLASLIGEDKIAKTVNTDESVALGTTLRAYGLITGKSNLAVKDKSHHRYDLSINGENRIPLFDKDSIAGMEKEVTIKPDRQTYDFAIFEDDSPLYSYQVANIDEQGKSLGCVDKEITARISFNINKVVEIVKADLKCSKKEKKGLFKNLLKDNKGDEDDLIVEQKVESINSTDSFSNDTTSSPNSDPKKINKNKVVSLKFSKGKFFSVAPLNSAAFKESKKKLNFLNSRDKLKAEIDHLRNILEAQCYNLRGIVDQKEDAITEGGLNPSEFTDLVAEIIEWLDFESDDASTEELEMKINLVNEKKTLVKNLVEMSDSDLSFDNLKRIYSDATSKLMKIQGFFMDAGDEISQIRKKYEAESLDFDGIHDKLKLESLKNPILLKMEKLISSSKAAFENFAPYVEKPKKFDSLPKDTIFKHLIELTKGFEDLEAAFETLHRSHQGRLVTLNSKFDSLLKSKTRKEERKRLREEKRIKQESEKESDKSTVSNDSKEKRSGNDSSTTKETSSSTSSVNSKPVTSSSSYFEHDEL